MNQQNTLIKNICYFSRASSGLTQKDVVDICETSKKNNRRNGVTGYIMIVGDFFMQFIEGSPFMVDSLLEKIELDPRHSEVTVFVKGYASRRYFPDWSMELQPLKLDDFKIFNGLHNLQSLQDLKKVSQVDIKLHQLISDFSKRNISDNYIDNE